MNPQNLKAQYTSWDQLVHDLLWKRERFDVTWESGESPSPKVAFIGSDGSQFFINEWDLRVCPNRHGRRMMDTPEGRRAFARAVNCLEVIDRLESHASRCDDCGVAEMLEL